MFRYYRRSARMDRVDERVPSQMNLVKVAGAGALVATAALIVACGNSRLPPSESVMDTGDANRGSASGAGNSVAPDVASNISSSQNARIAPAYLQFEQIVVRVNEEGLRGTFQQKIDRQRSSFTDIGSSLRLSSTGGQSVKCLQNSTLLLAFFFAGDESANLVSCVGGQKINTKLERDQSPSGLLERHLLAILQLRRAARNNPGSLVTM